MNENFNGLNEANSLDNNEMNNQSSLEPALNGINNTETLNVESESFAQSNNVYENTLSATNSENIVVSEKGAPVIINPISLNESASVDTNDTTAKTQASMNTPEPVTFNASNTHINNFTMNVGATNNEGNMKLNEPEVVSPIQNIEMLETNVNAAPVVEQVKKKNKTLIVLIVVLILTLSIVIFYAISKTRTKKEISKQDEVIVDNKETSDNSVEEYINCILNNQTEEEIINESIVSVYKNDKLIQMTMISDYEFMSEDKAIYMESFIKKAYNQDGVEVIVELDGLKLHAERKYSEDSLEFWSKYIEEISMDKENAKKSYEQRGYSCK